MSETNDESIIVEVAFSSEDSPQFESQYYVKPNAKFGDVILEVIGRTSQKPDLDLTHWIIATGRSEKSSFFPIAANEKQVQAWKESQKKKRINIPIEETKWVYSKIIEKYKVQTFHIKQKK
jgi:hypothetical protein